VERQERLHRLSGVRQFRWTVAAPGTVPLAAFSGLGCGLLRRATVPLAQLVDGSEARHVPTCASSEVGANFREGRDQSRSLAGRAATRSGRPRREFGPQPILDPVPSRPLERLGFPATRRIWSPGRLVGQPFRIQLKDRPEE
jgi:hypothetical protein